jgi:hypothetical protein
MERERQTRRTGGGKATVGDESGFDLRDTAERGFGRVGWGHVGEYGERKSGKRCGSRGVKEHVSLHIPAFQL